MRKVKTNPYLDLDDEQLEGGSEEEEVKESDKQENQEQSFEQTRIIPKTHLEVSEFFRVASVILKFPKDHLA